LFGDTAAEESCAGAFQSSDLDSERGLFCMGSPGLTFFDPPPRPHAEQSAFTVQVT